MTKFFKSLCVLNSVSLVLTVIYWLFPGDSVWWNGYGGLLLVSLIGTSVASVYGSRHSKLDIAYLLLSTVGLFAVMLINTIVSLNPTNESSRSALSAVIMMVILAVGVGITGTPVPKKRRYSRHKRTFTYSRESKLKKVSQVVMQVLLSVVLLTGCYLAYVLVTRTSSGLAEVAVSQYSLFYSLIFLNSAGLLLKVMSFRDKPVLSYTASAVGVVLFVVFALPFLSIPSQLNDAEDNFTEAFGNEWEIFEDNLSTIRETPLSIPAYFFGLPSENYALTEDILYYEGTEGVDEGLELRFDVYTPLEDAADLPGEGATLIRIHGGGWDTGGKGEGNFAQMNKYFAAQGYVVFDVQYGLNDQDQFVEFAEVPDEVAGAFSIDDMVRHLGLFTTYLADHHEEYGADIDSVFISGGSAGGHLGNALGLSGNQYDDTIDSRLTVSGLIPFYPANGLAQYRDLTGEEGLVDPALMVEEDSPPALIYQGDKDAIVDPQVAKLFREAYLEQGNTESAIIWMPYGAHGSDLYFSGFYNQTFIYYMERFMYQYR